METKTYSTYTITLPSGMLLNINGVNMSPRDIEWIKSRCTEEDYISVPRQLLVRVLESLRDYSGGNEFTHLDAVALNNTLSEYIGNGY